MSETTTQIEDLNEAPLQFSIKALLLLQFVCAVFFALLMSIGIFAVMLLFIAVLIYAAIRVKPENLKLKRTIIDVSGGLLLPTLCFLFDPIFFESANELYPLLILFVVLQMLTLLIWMVFGRWIPKFGAFIAGMLTGGCAIAGMIGIGLLPFSFLGLIFVLIGALGFVPFLTAVVFGRNVSPAFARSKKVIGSTAAELTALLGIVMAFLVPIATYVIFGEPLEMAMDLLRENFRPWGWIEPPLFD